MGQLLLRLSCCASPKKSNPDLQRSLENFSFDLSTPTQTTTTGEGINTSRILSQKKKGKKPNEGSFYVSEYLFFDRTARQTGRIAASGAADWAVGGDQEPKSGAAVPTLGKDPPPFRLARIWGEGADRKPASAAWEGSGAPRGAGPGANVASIAALSFPFAHFPLVVFSVAVSCVLTALAPTARRRLGRGGLSPGFRPIPACPVLAQALRIAKFRFRIREPRIPNGVGRNRALNKGWADRAEAPSPRIARAWLRRDGPRLGRVAPGLFGTGRPGLPWFALGWIGLDWVGRGGRRSWVGIGLAAWAWPSRNGWVGL